jgi:hypothetical protein
MASDPARQKHFVDDSNQFAGNSRGKRCGLG